MKLNTKEGTRIRQPHPPIRYDATNTNNKQLQRKKKKQIGLPEVGMPPMGRLSTNTMWNLVFLSSTWLSSSEHWADRWCPRKCYSSCKQRRECQQSQKQAWRACPVRFRAHFGRTQSLSLKTIRDGFPFFTIQTKSQRWKSVQKAWYYRPVDQKLQLNPILIPGYSAGKEKGVKETPLHFALEERLVVVDGKVRDAIDDAA